MNIEQFMTNEPGISMRPMLGREEWRRSGDREFEETDSGRGDLRMSQDGELRILMFNARSMNYASTADLLIRQKDYKADIVMIVETWQKCARVYGYTLTQKDTSNTPYGGLAIYSRVEYVLIKDEEDQPNILHLRFVVKRNRHVHVLVSYFPPQLKSQEWEAQFQAYK